MKFGVVPTFLTVTAALSGLILGAYLQQQESQEAGAAGPTVACDPAAATGCPLNLAGQTALLRFTPQPEALRPFQAELVVNEPIAGALLDFDMAGMEMGVNEVELQPAAARQKPAQGQRWLGKVVLPVCSSGRRDWLARLEIDTETQGRQVVTIPFELQ